MFDTRRAIYQRLKRIINQRVDCLDVRDIAVNYFNALIKNFFRRRIKVIDEKIFKPLFRRNRFAFADETENF